MSAETHRGTHTHDDSYADFLGCDEVIDAPTEVEEDPLYEGYCKQWRITESRCERDGDLPALVRAQGQMTWFRYGNPYREELPDSISDTGQVSIRLHHRTAQGYTRIGVEPHHLSEVSREGAVYHVPYWMLEAYEKTPSVCEIGIPGLTDIEEEGSIL